MKVKKSREFYKRKTFAKCVFRKMAIISQSIVF